MAGKKVAPTVDPVEISDVVSFINAKDALEAFVQDNPDVFDQYRELVDRYNATLQAADKAVRGREVTCGPWHLYSYSVRYDAETLYNVVGRDKFLEVGGSIETVTKYDLDKKRLEASLAQRKISEDNVAAIRKDVPSFHAPKPAVLP